MAEKIEVLGDIEGNGERFFNSVRMSAGLYFKDQDIELREGFRFIFIGDSIDRGPGSLRILQSLVNLKKKYSDRVVLLKGNRDLNKLRFLQIFSDEIAKGLNLKPNDSAPILKLKETLKNTNANDGFEYRRQELLSLRNSGYPWQEFLEPQNIMSPHPQTQISDREVFISLIQDVLPGGILLEYLKLSQVAYVHEDSKGLFVHGGLSEQSMGRVPGDPNFYENLREWVERLNAWAQPLPPEIMDYQRPLIETPGRNDKSVIYGRFSDPSGQPQFPSPKTQEYLFNNGILYIGAGHTPYGNIPVVLSSANLKILLVDNSYASHNRGTSALITESAIEIKGFVAIDGPAIYGRVPLNGTSLIGQKIDQWRVLGKVEGSQNYLLWRVGENYKVEYKMIAENNLKSKLPQICEDLFY